MKLNSSSDEIKGQILWFGTMSAKIEHPERYNMRAVYCPNCNEYLGAYNTYYHPEGYEFNCLCGATAVQQPQSEPQSPEAKQS